MPALAHTSTPISECPCRNANRGVVRRADPLEPFWGSEIVPLLETAPGLRPITIFNEMRRRHAGFSESWRSTLERRTRLWQVLQGQRGELVRTAPLGVMIVLAMT